MGQYHQVINMDKKQVLNPHKFGNGIKLLEFGMDGGSTMTGLAILLAVSNGRGGGDLHSDNKIIGTWAGDRIAIVGDYWEADEAAERGIPTWEQFEEWEDISLDVLKAMCDDPYLKQELAESALWGFGAPKELFTPEELAEAQKRVDARKENQ